jgi:V/A-type H+-transporting ATPase subunit A
MILSISPPGGDFTEPVTQACLKNTGAFLMLDTALANKRHFPAVNYFQSYSLYEQDVIYYFKEQIDPEWETLINRCKEILQIEEKLKEIAEIVGYEGLQDRDRLIMYIAEKIRRDFLCQNAYSEDAFSRPEDTFLKIKSIIKSYDDALEKLDKGISFDSLKL